MTTKDKPGTEVANRPTPTHSRLLTKLGAKWQIDPAKIVNALKQTAFRTPQGKEVSDAQMMALLVVADQYNLNPWTREIYAFPDKQGGIVPVVGVDGWSRIINAQQNFDGMEFIAAEELTTPEGGKECPIWMECVMHRKDHAHAIVVREYLDECYREPFQGKNGPVNGPWQSHTKRMLRHKVMIQCARIAYGFVGIYDPDEAERISEAVDSIIEVRAEMGGKPRTTRPQRIQQTPIESVADLEPDEAPPSPGDAAISDADRVEIRDALRETGMSEQQFCEEFVGGDVESLTIARLGEALEWIYAQANVE